MGDCSLRLVHHGSPILCGQFQHECQIFHQNLYLVNLYRKFDQWSSLQKGMVNVF